MYSEISLRARKAILYIKCASAIKRQQIPKLSEEKHKLFELSFFGFIS